MTEAFIIGLCAIVTVIGLIRGDVGRPTIVCALVVGWGVGLAHTLADTGTALAANLGDFVAQLGGAL